MTRISWLKVTTIAAVTGALSAIAVGATPAAIQSNVDGAMTQFYSQGNNHRALAEKASAILVFPKVTKAGAGVGGEYGEGALQVHGKTVGYYKVRGASVGATLGAEQRSEVILFMTENAKEKFLSGGDWTIGADTNVAFVKGAGAQLNNETLSKPVLAYVFNEKGLMADASLEGAKVSKLAK
ncbi:MAG TPA: YSC84-related protein [Steroidobacteraceae bacterium]|nr:YSC84-related protein [Steroidobacteraceae bacterium]